MMDTLSSGTLQSSTFSGSSKTGSSRSKSSRDSQKDRDRDFTKDNSTTPIDLECNIQAERITKILNEAVQKIKLALCLPNLVHEFRTLHQIVSSQHMEDLLFIFEQYENPLFSASLLNVSAMEDIKAGDVSLKNRLNPELGHLIYIMNSYPELKAKVEDMVEEMKKEQAVRSGMAVEAPGLDFLLEFEHFRELMIAQMSMTAADELTAKINLRKLQASNDKLLDTIKEYTETLKEEHKTFDKNMTEKKEIITRLQLELNQLNHEAHVKLKKKILDSDRQMVLATRSHTVKSEMLHEEEVESRESYESQLKMHLVDEKNQRARRFKVETQLLSWLQKYDIEMGDKQLELDEFTAKYDEEVEMCEKLEKDLAEQDLEYIPLMEEREAEYHQEMTEKMNKFMLEHAARVIQVAWREVLANRAEKKRLKKLQKRLLAEAEKEKVKKPPPKK